MKLIAALVEACLSDDGWAAAVREKGTGKVGLGDCHWDASSEFGEPGIPVMSLPEYFDFFDEGFMSPEGKFLSREEAIDRWRREAGLKPLKRDWGDSEDLWKSDPALIGS